ncbi:ATP-binding cassette domain-containing protein [Tistrella bauzanensis]
MFLGVFLVREGTVSIGALIASVILCGRALAPLAQVATLLTRLNHAAQSYRAIDRLMALTATVEPGRTYLTRPRIDGRITFRGVSFTYPRGRQPALTQAGFIVQPGEKVAVLGRIGSGKSTIVRLAAGLYGPSEGTVLLDDVDLRQLHPDELSRHVTAVLQDAPLFSGTVRDNILMGADEPSDERMLAAAGVAGVHDFIGGMTDGYDVMLGERGEGLSGGQRQAIALARALVSPARVLVMDEPTASMDVRSETLFVKRLKPHLGDRTLILVTHRMSMLELVDRVIVLDHGRVVADGPKAEVLSALQGPVADAPANRPDAAPTPAKMPKRRRPVAISTDPTADLFPGEAPERRSMVPGVIILTVCLAVIALIVWAAIAELDQVTRGDGRWCHPNACRWPRTWKAASSRRSWSRPAIMWSRAIC